MVHSRLLSAGCLIALAAAAHAQCTQNVFPVTLVHANGTPAPTALRSDGQRYAQFQTEAVYLAFDPATPSGTYYVHVTNVLGNPNGDEVLSGNDPMDRFVTVQNAGGVISLSLPFTNNVSPAVFGAGLGGVGQSLLLNSLISSSTTPCEFAVQVGDVWQLGLGTQWPYIVQFGFDANLGRCAISSYGIFRIGDGSGSDVSGRLFDDADRDATSDAGEAGVAGIEVRLVGSNGVVAATTDAAGAYTFSNVPAGTYSLEIVTGSAYAPTGSSAKSIEICGCGDVVGQDFGVAMTMLTCDPRPRAFWMQSTGLAIVHQQGILATLPALQLVNTFGMRVAPGNLLSFRLYLGLTNSINMAYRLSAELAVMHCNVLAGFVDPMCVVNDPVLGQITVSDLIQQAIGSLAAHPLTLPCSPHRAEQTRLKNALLNANLDQNWL